MSRNSESRSDWQALLVQAVGRDIRNWDPMRQHLVQIRYTATGFALLTKAALAHGVSRTHYVRRSVAVQVARDLDMSAREVVSHNPAQHRRPTSEGFVATRDDGEGITSWCPHPGCDGSHLR